MPTVFRPRVIELLPVTGLPLTERSEDVMPTLVTVPGRIDAPERDDAGDLVVAGVACVDVGFRRARSEAIPDLKFRAGG